MIPERNDYVNPFIKKWYKNSLFYGMLPSLIVLLLFQLGPSIFTAIFSFTDISGLPGKHWTFIGFDNYKEFIYFQNARDTLDAFKRTISFSIYVPLFQICGALIMALLLNSKIKGSTFFRSILVLPVILGVTLCGLAWTLVLNPLDGPAQKLLHMLGTSSNFLSSYEQAFYWVIFIQVWMNLGYSMAIFLAGLQTIPFELYESGKIDGTSSRTEFRYITLPLLWPTITVNVLLAIIGSLQVFTTIYVTTHGQFNTQTLAMLIFQKAFNISKITDTTSSGVLRQGFAASVSMIMFVLVLVVTLISQYVMKRKEEKYEH